MQILPIVAKTHNKSRFNNNMQYPHIKTMPFGIEMEKKKFNFVLLLLDYFPNFLYFYFLF